MVVCQQEVVHFVDPRSVLSCEQLITTASQQQLSTWARAVDALDAKAKAETEAKVSSTKQETAGSVSQSAGKRGAGSVRKDAKDREIEKLREQLTKKTLALKSEKENSAKLRKTHKELQEQHADDADKLVQTQALLDARDKENKAAPAQTETRAQRERETPLRVFACCCVWFSFRASAET